MPVHPANAADLSTPASTGPRRSNRLGWVQVVVAAVLMVATLPGRTQGLGLVTEPLLEDLKLDRLLYANLNLWATLLGALFCFPAGWAIDRWGLSRVTTVIAVLLGAVVWAQGSFRGDALGLFVLLLATRALGQSALSVCSISTVGKWFSGLVGLPMGVFSILLSVFFAVAFGVVGASVSANGWRIAWIQVAYGLLFVVAPVALFVLREPRPAVSRGNRRSAGEIPGTAAGAGAGGEGDATLLDALRTPAFWVFAGAGALFNLVASGLGLFNEAVLAERGFDRNAFHVFLVGTTLMSLVGQFACGWLARKWRYQTLTFAALALYALGLAGLPVARAAWQLWVVALLVGIAGGMIIVVFFSIWSEAYGRRHLGRIQGAAQMFTVISSGLGPVLFAQCHARFGSFAPILLGLAPVVVLLGVVAWRTDLRSVPAPADTGGSRTLDAAAG